MSSILFFVVTDTSANPTLWRSDGTSAGTKPITRTFAAFSALVGVSFAGNFMFTASHQLWKSDGTDAGTLPVTNLSNGIHVFRSGSSQVFFSTCPSPIDVDSGAYYNNNLCTLWTSNGTAAGTQQIRDFDPREGHLARQR